MNSTRSSVACRGLCLATIALLAACRGRDKPAQSDGTFALGVGATPGKPGYEEVTRGLQMAVQRLNEDPDNKVKFSLRAPDASAASAVQIAQALRDDPAVIAVVGHPESGSTIEALPVYADAEHQGANAVAAVSPTASSPRLTGMSPWFFRVAPSDNDAARFVAQYVMDSLHYTTAAVIYRNDSYGRDWSARFTEAFQAKRGTVVTRDPYLTGPITEWKAYALHLAKLRPQVVLFPGDAEDAKAMIRALRAAKVDMAFLGGDGTEDINKSSEFAGAQYVAFYLPERARQGEAKRFVDAYRAKYKEEPNMFAALSYDAALAIGRTVMAGARTRTEVRDGLEKLVLGTTALDGAGGKIAFNKDHDVDGRTVVIATVGGGAR